jgi:hypothetical protein
MTACLFFANSGRALAACDALGRAPRRTAAETALKGLGAKKLVEDVAAEADPLIQRAEDMLWSETQSRIPWKDVISRAQSNVRWQWLPPKGLET